MHAAIEVLHSKHPARRVLCGGPHGSLGRGDPPGSAS